MSKMTDWFPPHIKPVHKGVYEIKFSERNKMDAPMYATWNGWRWSMASHGKNDVYHIRFFDADQNKYWRGFTEEQQK